MWLGHATFLLTLSNKIILTDPFLTEFISPVPWAGPRRFVKPGTLLEKLPPIDFIVLSHNHYDHLHDETIRHLKFKDRIQVLVPMGLKSFFTERGYENIHELDWGETISFKDLKFRAQPAVHDSGRSLSERNPSLWSSWVISTLKYKFFFAGDTAYSESFFKTFSQTHGRFDYAILPMGAYGPRQLMWTSHVTPEEAVSIGRETNSKVLVASHWGTVSSLCDEPMWQPPKRFRQAAKENDYKENQICIMKVGGTRQLKANSCYLARFIHTN
ncbi:MAG: MBL fold metallo-hydrolase [Gammaproteobacteria bacterium]|nr:MBL fold metallo-hydrolase [Gammaproteobacteria bacterium]